MIVKAWNNGAHNRNGSGYGFKVSHTDRDAFFKPEWKSIFVEIEGEEQAVEIEIDQENFWSEECRELKSDTLGKWLRRNGLAPWPRINPPAIELDLIEENRFHLRKAHNNPKGAQSFTRGKTF